MNRLPNIAVLWSPIMFNPLRTFMVLVLAIIAVAAAEGKTKRALLIGLDGVRPDALAKAKTPNIDALIKAGAFTGKAEIFGERYRKNPSVSGPGWGSILTGVWADKHGVHDNKRFTTYRKYPTLFTHIKKAYPDAFTAAVVNWKPLADHLCRDAGTIQWIAPKNKDYAAADVEVTKAAAKLLAEKDPLAMFVYFSQIDETGHKKGFHPSVPEYIAALERVDTHVGEVLAAVKKRPKYAAEDWIIVVTTDHGGKGRGHSNKGRIDPEIYTVFLLVSGESSARGKIAEQAYIVDAPATVLAHLGIKVDEQWKLDGRAVGLKSQATKAFP